jgi:tetratricopeptide (TPR) repeat protein
MDVIGDKDAIVATNCNLSNYFEKNPNIKYQYTPYLERSSVDWDYGLFGVNYIHPYQLRNNTWQAKNIIKTFYHKGNPLVVLVKRNNKTDLAGIEQLESGHYEIAQKLLEESLKDDPSNVWLFVLLAKNCFNTKEFNKFDELMEEGFKLHAYYEPLFLLSAQKLFNDKKYQESLEMLESLEEINSRYKNAAPLLKAVNEKLNR